MGRFYTKPFFESGKEIPSSCSFSLKSAKTGRGEEKCCTQRVRKRVFAHSNPLGDRIWGWIFSSKVIQALFIITVRQNKESKNFFFSASPFFNICSVFRSLNAFFRMFTVMYRIPFICPCVNTCQHIKLLWSEPRQEIIQAPSPLFFYFTLLVLILCPDNVRNVIVDRCTCSLQHNMTDSERK